MSKLAKRREHEENPDAPKCPNCKTPGQDEQDCYFGANLDNMPPEWNLTEAQKKVVEEDKQAKKPIRPKIERRQQSSSKNLN